MIKNGKIHDEKIEKITLPLTKQHLEETKNWIKQSRHINPARPRHALKERWQAECILLQNPHLEK